MSNLSDLLPAGGGAKVITATASGNLSTGQTVILQSDGTVKAVEQTTISNSVGSTTAVTSQTPEIQQVVYATNIDKFVYIWKGTNSYLYAALGTVSGTSISFGTTTTIESSSCAAEGNYACYDSTNERVAVCYRRSSYGRCRVLNPQSDGSIGIGSEANFSTVTITDKMGVAFNSTEGRVMVAYAQDGSGDPGKFALGTISGGNLDDITFTSSNSYESGQLAYPSITYDSSKNAVVVLYSTGSGFNYKLRCKAGRITGDSTNWGSEDDVTNGGGATNEYPAIGYDASANVPVIVYEDRTDNNYGKAMVLTVTDADPPQITLNTAVLISGNQTFANSNNKSLIYNSATQKFIVVWKQYSTHKVYSSIGTTSSTSISFESAYEVHSASGGQYAANYDPDTEKIAVFTRDTSASTGVGLIYTSAGTTTNSANFAGITNQAINNSASGEVVVEGGVITNGSLLSSEASSTFGSEVVFNAGATRRETAVYDTGNDKVVISFQDEADSNKGKSIVGTVSGTSISYGSEVEFNSGDTQYIRSGYDPDQGKVVIAYRDQGNSNYGTAIVGTVSGTSISFGSEVVFESAETITFEVVYDTSNDKIVIFYLDEDNSNYGTAIVGTVSGTSISFGTPVVFESTTTNPQAAVFDSTNNKILVAYRAVSVSKLIVGTVSGTSISFGSTTTYSSTQTYNQSLAHDTSSGKNVLTYRDEGNSAYGTAVVATISGTSVSVGTAVVFNAATTQATSALYDPTTNATFVFYKDGGNSDYGTAKGGIVSGTDITFGSASVWNTGNPGSVLASVKDPDQNKAVVVYTDYGNSQYGTAVVGTLSTGVPNFTLNSTYYVQDDGTLSTTSSSVTAGKAIANTTLLLKG